MLQVAYFTGPSAKNESDLTGCTCVPYCRFLSSTVLQTFSGSYVSSDNVSYLSYTVRQKCQRRTFYRDGLSLDLLYEVRLTVQFYYTQLLSNEIVHFRKS